ncbi:MAG: AMP-binding protein [Velocimicrobium sp.]
MKLEEMTVNQLLSYNAKHYPHALAIEYHEYHCNWMELNRISDHLALKYLDYGIHKGTHVGIFGPNSPNWVFTYLALAKIGAVSVLINFNYKKDELRAILNYSNVEYLCYADKYKENDFIDIIKHLRKQRIWRMRQYIYIGPDENQNWLDVEHITYESTYDNDKLIEKKAQICSQDILSMLFTSGTIAQPKGVMLTQYQMLNIAKIACEQMRWKQNDKICLTLSLFHCFGLSTGLLASIVSGCSICIVESFRSKQVLAIIEKKKCTVLNGVPTMFLAMMKNEVFDQYDLSSLKSGIIAGAGIRTCDYRNIISRFHMEKLQQSFGQTEASPSITFSDFEDSFELKEASVGKVIPNTELRIVDEMKHIVLEPFVHGEIQIKGFHVMQFGYYKKKMETKKVFTADGWLKTGDIGYLDTNSNLYITGRKKDIIIRCGENISPLEIEETIMQYDGILDVKVFGVPDPFAQEEIVAAICCTKAVMRETLLAYLKMSLANYKVPKYIYGFQEFPLLANGKVDIKTLKGNVLEKVTWKD